MVQGVNAMGLTAIDLGLRGAVSGVFLLIASYWLYLIHMPIVMALQVAVSQLGWPGPVKFAIILAVALPAMLASYHLLVRFSIVGVVLNGRRAPREPAPAAAITGPAVP
ncbi:hypothetical protein [Bradyrhizobium sp. 25ACV]